MLQIGGGCYRAKLLGDMGDWEGHNVVQHRSTRTTDSWKDALGQDYRGIWVTGRDIAWYSTCLQALKIGGRMV